MFTLTNHPRTARIDQAPEKNLWRGGKKCAFSQTGDKGKSKYRIRQICFSTKTAMHAIKKPISFILHISL